LRSSERRARLLRQWRAWGVAGVKADYMQSDSQKLMAWYQTVARAAAANDLILVFHGSTLPRGIQSRWPNVLTMEAVMGAEHYKGRDAHRLTATQNATLPFTRNVVGSMDYTPVTFSAPRRETSLAHELALSVVFESGLQTFADRPESYDAQPIAEEFLEQVPAAWDDTRLLAGYPGRSAALARRHGANWLIGAINAGHPRTFRLSLGFLSSGRNYQATVVTDGGGTLTARQLTVTRDTTLVLPVADNGGAAVRLTAV
jgi:alpha-glucosidase